VSAADFGWQADVQKKQILFVHSAGPQGSGQGSSHLLAVLRQTLGSEYELRHPIMPEPDNPTYALWKKQLETDLSALDDDARLIGHSLGGSVLLKRLSEKKHEKHIAALFLVATPFWGSPGWQMNEFVLQDGFAAKLPRMTRVFLYHSRDDDVVPFAHLALYARALPQATVRELDGYKHMFKKRCRELLEYIKTS
jgi:serine hydrolase